MSDDKIKAAARKRMAETGKSYAAARREIIQEFQAGTSVAGDGAAGGGGAAGELQRFAISYDDMGPVSRWTDTLFGGGPAGGRVELDADWLRLRMADFRVNVPRASVRRTVRSSHQTRGTIGVHARRGRWLANGSADGLVEITIDPPCHRGCRVTECRVLSSMPGTAFRLARGGPVHYSGRMLVPAWAHVRSFCARLIPVRARKVTLSAFGCQGGHTEMPLQQDRV